MMEKVSITIPVYNVGKYIGRCLQIIISQDYSNLEIIIVNDGSTDTEVQDHTKLGAID